MRRMPFVSYLSIIRKHSASEVIDFLYSYGRKLISSTSCREETVSRPSLHLQKRISVAKRVLWKLQKTCTTPLLVPNLLPRGSRTGTADLYFASPIAKRIVYSPGGIADIQVSYQSRNEPGVHSVSGMTTKVLPCRSKNKLASHSIYELISRERIWRADSP